MPGKPELLPLVHQFNETISKWYPGLNVSEVFPTESGIADVLPSLPSMAQVTRIYESESELSAYIKSARYATGNGNPGVFCAIVFHSGPPRWEYSIRFNASEMQFIQQGGPAVDDSQVSLFSDSLYSYVSYVRPQMIRLFVRSFARCANVCASKFRGVS